LILWELFTVDQIGIWGQNVMRAVLVPGESALLALTAVTLLAAGVRALRNRRTFSSLLFMLVVVLMLVRAVPVPVVGDISNWIERVLATAGMRGLLLGVALGSIIAGLRAIFVTRPYVDE
jgi:hypothetical protein